MTLDTVVERVRLLVAPIVADLGLEIYDLELASGVLRLSVDTPPGQPSGVTLDNIALVSRLVSRELDHNDPMPGRYTLEVSSPGLERPLRTPAHFLRELNKVVSVRLHHAIDGRRRLQGVLLRADDRAIVVCLDDTGTEMSVAHSDIAGSPLKPCCRCLSKHLPLLTKSVRTPPKKSSSASTPTRWT